MSNESPPARPHRWRYFAGIAAFLTLVVAIDYAKYGYTVGMHNHAMQLPYIHATHDPSLYPGDRFMASMTDYFSYFWVAAAGITRLIPLETFLLGGHLATDFLKYAAIFSIAVGVFPRQPAAPFLAVWTNLSFQTDIGGEPLHWFYFAHTPFASMVGYWAVALAVRGRWLAALPLAGFIWNVHAMQSAYLLGMFLWGLVADWRRWGPGVYTGLALFPLAAAPGLYWMFGAGTVASPENMAELLRAFFPAHFFPSGLTSESIRAIVSLTVAFLVCLPLAPRTRPVARLVLLILALYALWIVGGALTEAGLLPGSLIKLHIFRASSTFATLVLLLVSGVVFTAAERISPWPPLLLLGLLGSSALLLGVSGLIDPDEDRYRIPALIVGVAVAGSAMLPWEAWRLGAATIGAAGLLFLGTVASIGQARGTREYFSWREPWFEVQRWAAANSAPDDLFLTPPDEQGFRVFSRRPVAFEWTDGAAMMWDAAYVPHWVRWYRDVVGLEFKDRYDYDAWIRFGGEWLRKSPEELLAIAEAEGASFLVLRKPYDWELEWTTLRPESWNRPFLFENEKYYVIPAGGEGA